MLFDSKIPIRPSGLNAAGTVPKGWAFRKALEQPPTLETDAADPFGLLRGLRLHLR
jgi:hypothetical protein